MKIPYFVTFTGVDDYTDLGRLVELSKRFPIEWGVLVGGNPDKARYPGVDRVNKMSELSLKNPEVSSALHLCGMHAGNAQDNQMLPVEYDCSGYGRIQVNAIKYDFAQLERLSDRFRKDVIYQHRAGPFPPTNLPAALFPLHDESGGRGKVPESRPVPTDIFRLVGYAGGIGPDNVVEVLEQIQSDSFWIDMETKLRTDDRFDLDICETVCKLIWPNRD